MTPVRLTGTGTPRCAPPLNPRLRMKITLDTATLTSELFKLQGIVSSKSTLPMTTPLPAPLDTAKAT